MIQDCSELWSMRCATTTSINYQCGASLGDAAKPSGECNESGMVEDRRVSYENVGYLFAERDIIHSDDRPWVESL